jgi:hypothetical protein
MQNEIDEQLVPLLSNIFDEGLSLENGPHLVRREPVFSKHVVEVGSDCMQQRDFRMKPAGNGGHSLLLPCTDNCSDILPRSEPLTTPIATFFLRARSI